MDRALERDLVDRLRAGDPAAIDEVHDLFNVRLFNFLARLSGRRDTAEDLLEETWLRLVMHVRGLREDTELGAWLFTVARNLYVSYCRSRSLEDAYAPELLGLWPAASREPSPFEAAQASETLRHLESALASLPVTYREALLLVCVEGLRAVEAAEICGVTPDTMRQRVSRGRALLARRLGKSNELSTSLLAEEVTP